jgi:hypothetical protein
VTVPLRRNEAVKHEKESIDFFSLPFVPLVGTVVGRGILLERRDIDVAVENPNPNAPVTAYFAKIFSLQPQPRLYGIWLGNARDIH